MYISKNEKDTIKLGEKLGKDLKGGEVFLLTGELGGGKTQLVKGIAKGLGVKKDITSPTFTYEKIYNGKKLTLYHFDLYREVTLDPDIRALMTEAFSDERGVTAIEWAERMGDFSPGKGKKVKNLKFSWKGESERSIEIK